MYGNYYTRRVSDHPLPRKNQVLPENGISSALAGCEMKEIPSKQAAKPLKEGEKREKRHTLKGVATTILNAIRFEKAANFRKHGWRREVHGGLKMWVNEYTGEVSTEKPWKLDFGMIRETLKPTSTPPVEMDAKKKKKRLSLTQRLSIIFFGNKENVNDTSVSDNKVKAKEYSDTTIGTTRTSSGIQDTNHLDTKDKTENENNENLSSEMKELFKMFDDELKKKKSLLN